MRERNEPEAKRVLNEILGRIMLGSGFETMKARIVELIVVISRAVADPNNAEQVLEDNQKLIENALAFEDMGDLCEWMTAVLERYLGYIFITEQNASRIVRKALAYMDGRFASPALPLAEVAHAAGVSREYLSRIFKRETGQSFGAYMTKQRVDHAKKMLSAAADSGDVALACGFSDTSYFCKVFKKNTGVTPGAWRNLRVR
ncbi:MAG: helix-turn-helix transcriptional regulator [Firmicutes bacterium]|nr:helix-turn-helix transcriptional regulator [Bacillota bacterium]